MGVTSEKIVGGGRLSFPALFEPKDFNGDGNFKYQSTLLLSKTADAKLIKQIEAKANEIAEKHFGKGKVPKKLETCIIDGDEEDMDGYADHVGIRLSNKKRPPVVNRDKSPVYAEDNIVYAGCYVKIAFTLWVQDNSFGKRVNGNLLAVQFIKDGEPFGEGPVDVDDVFDNEDDDEDVSDL